jgi:hypothetical protein
MPKKKLLCVGIVSFILTITLALIGCSNSSGGADGDGNGNGDGGQNDNGIGGGTGKATIVVKNNSSSSMITLCDVVSSGITVTSLASSASPIGTNSQKSCQVDPGSYGVQVKTNTGTTNGSGTFSVSSGETKTLNWNGTSF